jgi:putative salt-induced outer membrane protein YdiY
MRTLLFTFIFISFVSAQADTITIKGGSVIQGRVNKIHAGKLYITTEFSGEITIDLSKVENFSTDEEHLVQVKDGQKLEGKVSYNKEKLTVENADTRTESKKADITMLWQPGSKAPNYVAPFVRKWVSSLAFDLNASEGNTQEKNFSLQGKTVLQGEKDRLLFYLKFRRSEKEGETNIKEYIGGSDYEYSFAERESWYARAELENDEFEGIDLRTTIAFGYGHYFFKEDDKKLRGRIGLLYRHESYEEEKDAESTIGLDTGLRFDWNITDNTTWYTDITYAPSIEDIADFRAKHESALSFKMADSAWNFKLGINHEFNSEPVDDKQELDTTYFSRIEYSW